MIPLSILTTQVNDIADTPVAQSIQHNLATSTEESTYFIARMLMMCVQRFLQLFGLENNSNLFLFCYAVVVFLVALVIGMVIKWILVLILRRIGSNVKNYFYRYLVDKHFFTKLCRIVPPMIFIILLQFTLTGKHSIATLLSRLTWIYIDYILCSTFCTLADVIWSSIDSRANKKKLPLNGVVQLVKLIIWIIGAVIFFAIVFEKSPASMLAGLGAFSAVIMLIFKDNILGVVAGVQLAENDSLHEGDWIVPNGSDANGIVVGVGLTAIKIQNWDKTISTVPPYSLISNGFKNYRNMQLSKTRRIQRSYMIDADSVIPADDTILQQCMQITLLKDWIEKKIEQKKNGKIEDVNNSLGLADGSIDTNLGIFRAYLKIWLEQNPDISHVDDCFVNTLAQTSNGIPLQVYCFTSTSAWIPYEGIQSTVFEHIAMMLYKFHLYTFESASGRDTIVDGYLSPGKNPEYMWGLPYPFFRESGSPDSPGIPPTGLYSSPTASNGQTPDSASAIPSDQSQSQNQANA